MSQLPNTPAGRAAQWWLEMAGSGRSELPMSEVKAHVHPWVAQSGGFQDDLVVPTESLLKSLWVRTDFLDVFQISEVDDIYPHSIRMILAGADGKRWLFSCFVVENRLINWIEYDRGYKAGVTFRSATDEDGPALAEVERLCPIEREEGSFTYSRGDDFFAATRLMDESHIALAEFDSKVIGFCGAALYRARVGGEERRLLLGGHLRSHPEHRGGLYMALGWKAMDPWSEFRSMYDSNISYEAIGHRLQVRHAEMRGVWKVAPVRKVVRCKEVSGPAYGRPATSQDAEQIVEVLNQCHVDEEMYLPYDVASFKTRVERAPEVYSWSHIWISDHAVIGIWDNAFMAIKEHSGRQDEATWGLALDYGFLPGADMEFEALLKSRCGQLARQETDELSIFTSEHSPGYQLLSKLASSEEAFQVRTKNLAPPEGHENRGIYVDQIYF